MLTGNEQDTSMRAGLSLGGWKKKQPGRDVYDDARRQAFEWWDWDFETAWSPEQCGFVFGITGYNLTFYQFSEENNFVWDQRGFNTLVVGEAREFLDGDGDGGVIDDERLMLETVVESIAYGPEGVLVGLEGGGCIEAEYAIATFSLGVWQHDAVAVEPAFPRWKRQAIEQFQMGTYTKIFLQFAFDGPPFWDADTEYFLWADPATRGYYPVFQSLTAPGFLAGSGIIFVTVVDDQAYRVERQTDDQTRDEVMQVLRRMFPDKDIPDPVAFMYPRWSTDPMSYGSYSNWPVGMTLEKHQNLRANLDRLWFAGEHTSAQYYGFLHGAWFEGRDVGERIAGLVGPGGDHRGCDANTTVGCGPMSSYPALRGTTRLDEYDILNGWAASSFAYNLEDDE
ncbi:flavin-containing amine oxidoreductase-domain containing protein [Xylariomycetidae sp. FL2044]|nr:flavin-containing amine oxidoreductase-domain containing protein [Xylariomycetidae sp. FL2044]